MRKIISEGIYTIELENRKGEIIPISFDATDIEQVDSVFELMEFFDKKSAELEKRIKKLEKEYQDRVLIRQTLRVTKETLESINTKIDEIFGEGVADKTFLGSKSINMYVVFFDELENHFPAIMKKAENSIDTIKDKYDTKVKDDEVL